jgi:hypothetical protein
MTTNDWTTETTTYTDAKGGTRTALVNGSYDVVDADGERVLQINVFTYPADRSAIVDVIDVDNLFEDKCALTDPGSARTDKVRAPFAFLVSADLRGRK